MSTWRKPRISSGQIIILIIVGLLLLVVLTGNLWSVIGLLYSKTMILVIVVVLIEYLLLKGADRTGMYRRELEAARHKRRDDLLAMREIESLLVKLQQRLGDLDGEPGDEPNPRETLIGARVSIEESLRILRGRI